MARSYVPEAGDAVWLDSSPQTGHKQAEHYPALVLSPASYNLKTGMISFCPMTTELKG